MLWGKRAQEIAPHPGWTRPDQMARPPMPVAALFVHEGVPYDDVRDDFDFGMVASSGGYFVIKTASPYVRELLDKEGLPYFEWATNKPYWGVLAPVWRDAEMRYYADVVLEFKPPPRPKKRPYRKGKNPQEG